MLTLKSGRSTITETQPAGDDMKWESSQKDSCFMYELDDKGLNKWMACFSDCNGHKGEARKAAQMALAAPDMLEALDDLLHMAWLLSEDTSDEFNVRPEVISAKAAIKKAGG